MDDDESVCRGLKKLVLSAGMDADTFTSSQDFVDLIEAMPWLQIDCAVLDLQMPKMNGFEVQEHLTQIGKTIPVIFMTAHHEIGVRKKALAAGAVAFLRKPFTAELFIKTLYKALRHRVDCEVERDEAS